MKCKICGTRINEGEKFCPKCGTEAGTTEVNVENLDESVEKKYCPDCGSLILGEHRFCVKCGANLAKIILSTESKVEINNEVEECRNDDNVNGSIQNIVQVDGEVSNSAVKTEELTEKKTEENQGKGNKYKKLAIFCTVSILVLGILLWQILAYASLLKFRNITKELVYDYDVSISCYKLARTSFLKNNLDEETYAYSLLIYGLSCYDKGDHSKTVLVFEKILGLHYDELFYSPREKGFLYRDLGFIYFLNPQDEFDNQKAIVMLEKGVSVDDPYCKDLLGYIYYYGSTKDKNNIEVNPDYDKAFSLLSSIYELPDIKSAPYLLGEMYLSGKGCKRDITMAKKCFEIAENKGNDDAKKALKEYDFDFLLGQQLFEEKKYEAALECLEKTKNPEALQLIYNIGKQLFEERKYEDSIKYLEKAKNLDTENLLYDAKYYVAYDMYFNNHPKSKVQISKFLNLLTEQAERGHVKSQILLGHFYTYSDTEKSYYFFKKASDNGNLEGRCALAKLYTNYSLPKYLNFAKAIELLQMPAEKNYTRALHDLGFIYFNNSKYRDYNKAFDLFTRAVNNNDGYYSIASKNWLADMYFNGDGVEKNKDRGIALYREVAKTNTICAGWAKETLKRLGY